MQKSSESLARSTRGRELAEIDGERFGGGLHASGSVRNAHRAHADNFFRFLKSAAQRTVPAERLRVAERRLLRLQRFDFFFQRRAIFLYAPNVVALAVACRVDRDQLKRCDEERSEDDANHADVGKIFVNEGKHGRKFLKFTDGSKF